MNIIKKVSIPFCGTMLALFALGNLLGLYSPLLKSLCGILGGIFFILIVLNFLFYPQKLKEDFNNPVQASVLGTFSMALMLISTYLKPIIGASAVFIWYIAILLHLLLIVLFTLKYVIKFDIKKVFASWYIVYVGIAVAGVSAKAFDKLFIGQLSFWFGLISLVILLIVVTYRYIKFEVAEAAKALICIYAAPTSLCLAAYISSFETKSLAMVLILLLVASFIFLFSLYQAIGILKTKFKPSFSALTFPFVISAIALKQSIVFLTKAGYSYPVLNIALIIEIIIAILFVAYVYINFVKTLFSE